MASAKREHQVATITASSVILDIEGTTSSISFVKDVLFPYIRSHLEPYINENWSTADFQEHVKAFRKQAQQDEENKVEGVVLIPEEGEENALKTAVIDNIKWQMDNDRKTKCLKDLQGLIMEKGYKSGDLRGHVYEDVEPSLRSWVESEKSVYIYSSGSVYAQKLLFGHSEKGDLLPLIKGHFDTSVGMKGDVNSYKEILKQISSSPTKTAFFTDIPKEAKAAKEAGLLAILVSREGNSPLSNEDKEEFQVITSFEDIEFEQNCKKRKTSSENTVNIDNKEVVSCSLSIDETNKPLSPQIDSKIEKKCTGTQETVTEESNEIKSIDTCSNNADELMDVDESPSEKASIDEIKTNENPKNTNQEDTSIDNMKKETVKSDFEKESSIPEKEEDLCKIEINKMEDDNTASDDGNKKEESISADTTPTNKDTADVECKNQVGEQLIENSKIEAINSDSKMLSKETSDKLSKTETEIVKNSIENHKEETIYSGAVTSDIKCNPEGDKIGLSVESNDKMTNNSESGNVEISLKEESVKLTCTNTEKIEHSKDVNKSEEENTLVSHETNKINEEKALSESEEKSNIIKSNEETFEKKGHSVEETSLSTDSKNENVNCVEMKDDSKSTSSQEILTEEALQSSTIVEKNLKDEEICNKDVEETKNENVPERCNGVDNHNLEDIAISKQETVELKDELQFNSNRDSESAVSLKENGESVESQNNTNPSSSVTIDNAESSCNKKTSKISAECEENIKLDQYKDNSSKTTDEIECVEKSQETLQKCESNGLIHVESTDNETEVPLIKKTEDNSKEVMSELQDDKQEDDKTIKVLPQNGQVSSNVDGENLNGISSSNLKTENNGLIEEVAVEGKKCSATENTSVETVVEA